MEDEKLTKVTKKQEDSELQVQTESQRAEMELRRNAIETQTTEMQQKIQDEVRRQMSVIFASIASGNSIINLQSTTYEKGK